MSEEPQAWEFRDPEQRPLCLAAYSGGIGKPADLIKTKQHDLEQRTYAYGTPLHTAIFRGHLEAVKLLLSAGADTEALAPDAFGYLSDTALGLAARLEQRDIMKELWDYGASRDVRTSEQKLSALEIAAFNNRAGELVRDLLLWSDWDLEMRVSALWRAASRWNVDAVKTLVGSVQFEQSALDYALLRAADKKPMLIYEERSGVDYTDSEFINQGRTVNSLVDAGASPMARYSNSGPFALHIAARYTETTRGLETLLQRGAYGNQTDKLGRPPARFRRVGVSSPESSATGATDTR